MTYPFNAAAQGWMEEVKIILFGPSERLAVHDLEVQGRLKEAMAAGIDVMACQWCSDRMGISDALRELGIEVLPVGPVMSRLLKEGWASLSF